MVDLGKKHVCEECDTKYYDFGKPEPACPKCGQLASGEESSIPSRPAKARAEVVDDVDADDVAAPDDEADDLDIDDADDAEIEEEIEVEDDEEVEDDSDA